LALSLMKKDPELAKQFLNEDPDMALRLAETDPEAFKKLMLANPDLAAKLAKTHPELFKKLMMADPVFAKALANAAPELVKELMTEDPKFADWMGKTNPEFVKQALLTDPKFAATMLAQNPDMIQALMNDDPAFAQRLAEVNPALVKALAQLFPAFAETMSKRNPRTFKALLAGDPMFARAMATKNPDLMRDLMRGDPEFAKLMGTRNPDLARMMAESGTARAGTPGARIGTAQANNEAYEKNRQTQLEAEQRKQLEEAYRKGVDDITNNMMTEIASATKVWTEPSVLTLTQGEWANPKKDKEGTCKGSENGSGPGSGEGNAGMRAPAAITAGTVLFAVIETSVSSDEPGPVLATITNGRFEGAKLLGDFQSTGPRAEKVTLNFSTMVPKGASNSISIKAVAVDPDTARTAVASDVDHHYLLRYGMLLASSFMTGYSKVITQQGTVSTTAANGGSTTTVSPQLSGKKEIFAAFGDVGKALGSAAAENVNRANTITVDSGTGIGLLFMSDVSEPES